MKEEMKEEEKKEEEKKEEKKRKRPSLCDSCRPCDIIDTKILKDPPLNLIGKTAPLTTAHIRHEKKEKKKEKRKKEKKKKRKRRRKN